MTQRLSQRRFSHAQARQRYRDGASVADVAEAIGVSRQAINSLLGEGDRLAHLVARTRIDNERNAAVRVKARKLRAAGKSILAICAELNIGKAKASEFVRGVKPLRRKTVVPEIPVWVSRLNLSEDYRDQKQMFGAAFAENHCRRLAAEMRSGQP